MCAMGWATVARVELVAHVAGCTRRHFTGGGGRGLVGAAGASQHYYTSAAPQTMVTK